MSTHTPDARAMHGPADDRTARSDHPARDGALAMVPLIAGYIPFALVIGAACAEHAEPLAAWAGSWLIYGGSAHLATIRTLDKGGLAVAIFTGLVVNARLVVYSASLARHWTAQPRWFRVAAAGLIIDPTWVAAERHAQEERDPAAQRRYFLAAGLTLGLAWSGAIAVGAIAGARLGWLDVDIVAPLCLIALIGPGIRSRTERSVIAVAATVAVLTRNLPAGTGLLLAIVAGVAAGALHHRSAR